MFSALFSTSKSTLTFFNLRPPLLFIFPSSSFPHKNPNTNLHLQPPMASSSFVADYAKSKRSTCKTCSDTIAAKALRLGVITKDKQKGFDMTRWHHFQCFSFDSHNVPSVESIRGFDSLKSDDQEAMKKLVDEHAKVDEDAMPLEKKKTTNKRKADEDEMDVEKKKATNKRKAKDTDEDAPTEDKQKHTKNKKVKRTDEDVTAGHEQGSTDDTKVSLPEGSKLVIDVKPSDIKDRYEDATLLPNWKAFHTIIFLEKGDGLQDSSKIAAFDFDGCLAKTDVRRTGADAWSLMYKSIPEKLQKLYNDGYKLVIFTNESNISRWKNKRQKAVDSKIGRLNSFIELVKVPIQVFIACGFGPKDAYRKPKTGMWLVMEQHFNSGIPIDMDKSFYVGDAAGRKNDHSDADKEFAKDIGLKFYVPEEYFTQ